MNISIDANQNIDVDIDSKNNKTQLIQFNKRVLTSILKTKDSQISKHDLNVIIRKQNGNITIQIF
jgi:hypothetical protein